MPGFQLLDVDNMPVRTTLGLRELFTREPYMLSDYTPTELRLLRLADGWGEPPDHAGTEVDDG